MVKKMVTQCPLSPGELFPFYQFTANPAGTFWYHSHTAFQRDDGLSGIFVVRERDLEDVGCDLSEHVIHLQEWFRSPAKERYARAYMQKTCDVAEMAILAKKNCGKKA